LDRDGTIVEDPGFLHEPDKVKLLPGAAAAIRQLNDHGWLVVLVTNQSGIARGLYTVADYVAVQRRLGELLAAERAHLDGEYFCPHHPRFSGPCECRKPGLKLFRDAAHALDIDHAVRERHEDIARLHANRGPQRDLEVLDTPERDRLRLEGRARPLRGAVVEQWPLAAAERSLVFGVFLAGAQIAGVYTRAGGRITGREAVFVPVLLDDGTTADTESPALAHAIEMFSSVAHPRSGRPARRAGLP